LYWDNSYQKFSRADTRNESLVSCITSRQCLYTQELGPTESIKVIMDWNEMNHVNYEIKENQQLMSS